MTYDELSDRYHQARAVKSKIDTLDSNGTFKWLEPEMADLVFKIGKETLLKKWKEELDVVINPPTPLTEMSRLIKDAEEVQP